MTDQTPALSLLDVVKRYGAGETEVRALTDVSLDVAPGEFLAVMGASGSGKSTLLHLAGALVAATAGRVFVNGRALDTLDATGLATLRRRDVGLVFQRLNLIPTLTAIENVMLPLELDGLSTRAAREQAADALGRAGLTGPFDRYPDDLSGGQQQRVAIARGIVGDRKLLLADEPTGALDSVTGDLVIELLASLVKERNCALVLVTHEARFASWADRIVRLRDGVLIEETALDRLRRPGTALYILLTNVDLAHPLAQGRYGLRQGRPPRTESETVISRELARSFDLRIGSEVRPQRLGRVLRVVGIMDSTDVPIGAAVTGHLSEQANTSAFVDHVSDPPTAAGWEFHAGRWTGHSAQAQVLWTYVGGAIGLVIVGTVIAAAFAIGARRQLRTIGLLAASGASRATVGWSFSPKASSSESSGLSPARFWRVGRRIAHAEHVAIAHTSTSGESDRARQRSASDLGRGNRRRGCRRQLASRGRGAAVHLASACEPRPDSAAPQDQVGCRRVHGGPRPGTGRGAREHVGQGRDRDGHTGDVDGECDRRRARRRRAHRRRALDQSSVGSRRA